jgi:release factor glutamine methyltransferase
VAETALALTRKAAELFRERGIENGRLEAELLLASVLRLRRLDLYLQYDRPIEAAELETFRAHVRRRLRREPVQYILGETQFRGLTLRVDPRALIPRPETEVLAGEVLRWANERGRPLAGLDVGTGSGALALAMLTEGPFERVVATDLSDEALQLAAENAAAAGVADRLELRSGSLWAPLRPGERFDVIVSNPPYVGEDERATLQPEVRDWEPAAALFASAAGLGVLLALTRGAAERLVDGGLLALEVGAGQAEKIAADLRGTGRFRETRTVRDLAGRERIVLATRS